MEIEKTTYMNMLYDFYGALLTKKQGEYLALYYADDLSLSEISEELGVSRQAVYDNIRRSEKILTKYEKQLQLVAQFQERNKAVKQLKQHITTYYATDTTLQQLVKKIEQGDK